MPDPVTRLNAALEGRYRIESQLGEGGMATVYLADDLRHERKVALKVLKPELAAVVGAERFLAEIKTTANLQHPHILPLFDSGEANGFLFYVMPYVEGETLGDRLAREHQLPVDDAVQIAKNVAEALEYAHSNGVIHRDIKPANILLQAGKPVISDFGIALAVGVAGGGRLTETGLSLGTPHYMSPEQATGEANVGPATDVYALGCVLYEMLVGDPPHTASSAQAVLAKILTDDAPRATKARSSVPANVDAAIRKALEKLPADRFARSDDFARALTDKGFRYRSGQAAPSIAPQGLWNWLSGSTTAAALAAAALAGWALSRPEPPEPVQRFESPFRAGQGPISFGAAAFHLSPDGSMVVYQGPGDVGVTSQLWVRRWDNLDAAPIQGTELAAQPAVSPDGRELAFRQGGQIRVLSFDGGPTRTLAGGEWPRWGPDGVVYAGTGDSGVLRVSASGGPVDTVTTPRAGEGGHYLWDVLPGGDAALVHVTLDNGQAETRVLSLQSGELRSIGAPGGFLAQYAPSGHVLYFDAEGVLFAAPFDAGAGEVTGPAVPIIEDIGYFNLSANGSLMYSTGTAGGGADELVWVARSGQATPVEQGWSFDRGGGNYGWSLSPDDSQIALRIFVEGNNDIWIKQLPEGPLERVTFQEGEDRQPWWTPDGQTIMYISGVANDRTVWSARADGSSDAQPVLDDERSLTAGLSTPDGSMLVLRTAGLTPNIGPRDIVTFRPGIDSAAVPLIATAEFAEQDPAVSPDGRWIAYASNETGEFEVYVRPFPDVDQARTRVSTDGGLRPKWAHSGRELFFVDADNAMIAAQIETTPGFRVVDTEALFVIGPTYLSGSGTDFYDVSRDDQRFLMGRAFQGGDGRALVLVRNFAEELERMAPN